MENIFELTEILNILKKIKTTHQKKINLPSFENKESEKSEFAHKKQQKKELLTSLTSQLEKKVKQADLPLELTSKILHLLEDIDIKNNFHSLEQKIKKLNDIIKEVVQEKNRFDLKNKSVFSLPKNTPIIITPVIASQLKIPSSEKISFIQIQYDKEVFEKKVQSYFEDKIISKITNAKITPIFPVESKQEYPKKKGATYPKAQIKLEEKHKNEWMNLLVQEIQKKEKKGTIQTPKEIIDSFNKLTVMQQKVAIKAIQQSNPELLEQQKNEEQAAYEAQLKKNIERQKRKKEKRQKKSYQKTQISRLKEGQKEGEIQDTHPKSSLLKRLKTHTEKIVQQEQKRL